MVGGESIKHFTMGSIADLEEVQLSLGHKVIGLEIKRGRGLSWVNIWAGPWISFACSQKGQSP